MAVDRLAGALRHDRGEPLGVVRVRGHVLGVELVDQFSEQERVARGVRQTGGGELGHAGTPKPALDQRAGSRGAQRPRLETQRRRVAADRVEDGAPAVRRRRLGGRGVEPDRCHERDRQALQSARGIGEPAQRRLIGPVEIVDRDQQRRVRGEVGEQPVEAVDDRVDVTVGAVVLVEPERGAGMCSRTGEHPPALGLRGREDRGLEQLARDPERELALELARARAQRSQPGAGGLLDGVLEQPALAEPGLRRDHGQAAVAACRGSHHPAKLTKLAIALQQCFLSIGVGAHELRSDRQDCMFGVGPEKFRGGPMTRMRRRSTTLAACMRQRHSIPPPSTSRCAPSS